MKKYVQTILLMFICSTGFAQQPASNSAEKSHLKLYPKLATEYVNIYVEFDEPKDFKLILPASELNNEKKWEVNAKSSYQQSLTVNQLPEGSYSIVLVYDDKREEKTFTVKRDN